ncbi:hypothetical protein [Hahella sp. NBU794]|uniref:hypothetical protein n=1 Tax=Hahella sp. NBU794 TaxID=3422590 RepID=UPI003D6E8B9C
MKNTVVKIFTATVISALSISACLADIEKVNMSKITRDNVNSFDSDGWTPLHRLMDSCKYLVHINRDEKEECEDNTNKLLELGANPNMLSKNKYKISPLAITMVSSDHLVNLTKKMLNRDVDIHSKQYRNSTLLGLIVRYGEYEIFKTLLKKGLDVNSIAWKSGEAEKSIIEYGIMNRVASVKVKADRGIFLIIKEALANGAKMSFEGKINRTLSHAILSNDSEVVDLLLSHNIDMTEYDYLHYSIRVKSDIKIVNILLSKSIELGLFSDKKRQLYLSTAIEMRNTSLAKLFSGEH